MPREEGLRVSKSTFSEEERSVANIPLTVTLPSVKKHRINLQPAAAVIRRVQALIGITGRKAHAGGWIS